MDAFQAENTGVWSRSVWNLEPDFYRGKSKVDEVKCMVYVIFEGFPLIIVIPYFNMESLNASRFLADQNTAKL